MRARVTAAKHKRRQRPATSISLVVLLTLTTPWTKLLAALRSLFVPRMFILVLGMAYRYLFHLLGSVTDMYTARKARMVGAGAGLTGPWLEKALGEWPRAILKRHALL